MVTRARRTGYWWVDCQVCDPKPDGTLRQHVRGRPTRLHLIKGRRVAVKEPK